MKESNHTFHLLCSVIIIGIFVLQPLPALAQYTLSDSTVHRLNEYIESNMEQHNIPGVALAIVADNEIVFKKGYGISGPQKNPVTPDTPMILGSVSKSFTALAIMQLVEEGLVELDAPINRYFPDVQTETGITVRHLLTHTSGYSTASGRETFAIGNRDPSALQERADYLLHNTPSEEQLGEIFEYSNSNYNLLGAIVENVSETKYDDYIQQNILEPLQMTRSYKSIPEAENHGLATGYRYIFGFAVPYDKLTYNRLSTPSGYLVSTAGDMGKYVKVLLNKGILDSTRILGSSYIEQMFRPYKEDINYGFGWVIDYLDDTKVIQHGGDIENFSTYVWLVPDEGWGAVILINGMTYLSGPNFGAFKQGVGRIIAGEEVNGEIGNASLLFILYILSGLFVLQIIGAIYSGRLIRKWKNKQKAIPQITIWSKLRHLWLPLLINAIIIAIYLYVLPTNFGMTLRGINAFAPDAYYIAIGGSAFALVWSIIRTVKYRKLLLRRGTTP